MNPRAEIDRRPLVVAAVGLGIGLTLRDHPLNALFLLAVLAAAIRPGVRIAGTLFALLGLLLAPVPPGLQGEREPFRGDVRVAGVPRLYESGLVFPVRIGERTFQAGMDGRPDVARGDLLRAEGQLRPPSADDGYLRRGLSGQLRIKSWERVERGPPLFRAGEGVRSSFLAFCERELPRERAALLEALCLNVDALMTDDQYAALRRSGTVHVVSASGTHVVILVAAVGWLLRFLPIPRPGRLAVLAAGLLVYAVAAGLNPPIVRACLVAFPPLLAYLFRREGDGPSAWGLAALAILLSRPECVYDAGTQLSFAAAGALTLFSGGGEARAAVVASTATAPLAAFWFGQLPLLSIPANLVVAPAIGAATIGGLGSWLVSLVWPAGGGWLARTLVGPWIGGIERFASWVPRGSVLETPALPGWGVGLFFLLLVAAWRPVRRESGESPGAAE